MTSTTTPRLQPIDKPFSDTQQVTGAELLSAAGRCAAAASTVKKPRPVTINALRFFLFLVLFVCVAGPASAATVIVFGGSTKLPVDPWWDANWQNRRKITFDNTASGGNLTDFPVLVSLSSPANIDYAKTMDQGEDLRVLDADGTTVLKYEIEKWNEAGTSTVWVKVPQINSGVNTDYIWMYYNNPGETDAQDAANVWSNGYAGAWHLDED